MAESDQSEPINRSRAKQVESLLAEARKRLIDTGARNRLVHTNRRSKRPSTLSIVAQDLDSLFTEIVRNGRSMRFRSNPRVLSESVKAPRRPALSSFQAQPYEIADFKVSVYKEPHETSLETMAKIVKSIIDIEGPIHGEEVSRRIATLWGKERTGSRIAAAVEAALRHRARIDKELHSKDDFWFTSAQQVNCPVRDRSSSPLSVQKAEMLPPLEIAAAAARVLKDNGSVGRDEMTIAIARLLGFQRTGPDLRSAIKRAVDRMIKTGTLVLDQGKLVEPGRRLSPLEMRKSSPAAGPQVAK